MSGSASTSDSSAILSSIPTLFSDPSAPLPASSDLIAFILHAQLAALGFALKSIDGTAVTGDNKLPQGWTSGSQEDAKDHKLRYWKEGEGDEEEGGEEVEFKVVNVGKGKKVQVVGINDKTDKDASVTLTLSDYFSSSALPFSPSTSDPSSLFSSDSSLQSLLTLFYTSLLSPILPSLPSAPPAAPSRGRPPSPPSDSAKPNPTAPLASQGGPYLPDRGGPLGMYPSIGQRDLEPLGGLTGTGPSFPGGRSPISPLSGGGMHPTFGDLRGEGGRGGFGGFGGDGSSFLPPGARPPGARWDPVGPFAGGAPWPTGPGGIGPGGGAGGPGQGGFGGVGGVGSRRDPDAPGYSNDYDAMFG